MNKLYVAVSSAILAAATAAENPPSEAIGPFFRHYLKKFHLFRSGRRNARAEDSIDLQLADEKDSVAGRHKPALYDLAANNPHVIAMSIFSRKRR